MQHGITKEPRVSLRRSSVDADDFRGESELMISIWLSGLSTLEFLVIEGSDCCLQGVAAKIGSVEDLSGVFAEMAGEAPIVVEPPERGFGEEDELGTGLSEAE